MEQAFQPSVHPIGQISPAHLAVIVRVEIDGLEIVVCLPLDATVGRVPQRQDRICFSGGHGGERTACMRGILAETNVGAEVHIGDDTLAPPAPYRHPELLVPTRAMQSVEVYLVKSGTPIFAFP